MSKIQWSKVTVDLNRKLTHSEKEAVRDYLLYESKIPFEELQFDSFPAEGFPWAPIITSITIESILHSREVVEDLSEFLSEQLLNVHPTSAHTHYPRTLG